MKKHVLPYWLCLIFLISVVTLTGCQQNRYINDPKTGAVTVENESKLKDGAYAAHGAFRGNDGYAPFLKINVKNGIITWETQQTDYPRTRPDLPNHEPRGCARGASFSWYVYSAQRIKYPMMRGALAELGAPMEAVRLRPFAEPDRCVAELRAVEETP